MQTPDKYDQPHPVQGRVSVTDALREHFNAELTRRQQIGIARYGRSLETHNGRDAFKDAEEELYDALQYSMQGKIEHQDALNLLEVYRTLLGRLFMLGCEDRDAFLDETIYDPFLSQQAPNTTIRALVTRYCQHRFEGEKAPGSGQPATPDHGDIS